MNNKNSIFIAASIDGFIADKNGGIDWLHTIPNPDQIDMGYAEFTARIDAIVMGRTTFETVCGFDMEWPYQKPVFVLSNTMTEIPSKYEGKVFLVKGNLTEIVKTINAKGHQNLYIDGGKTIQSFLKEDLIDEMIITTIPLLLGGGFPLFSDLTQPINFECSETKIYLGKIVQNKYTKTK